MKELKQELEKEFLRKGKHLLIKRIFKSLDENSGCMLEVENVFIYLKYMKNSNYIDKYNAYIIITNNIISVNVSYNNLTLTSFHELKDNENIKQFADLYINKEEDTLYFVSSINEVEVLNDSVLLDIDILTASSSITNNVIIK